MSSSSTTTSRSSASSSEARNVSLPEPTEPDQAEPEPDPPEAGALFRAEIYEQPRALLRLLEHEADYARVAELARERGASIVRMVGHGSSDNAASYGVYAFGLRPRWTAFRDSISLTVHYGTKLDMTGTTAIGLSQSGRTPDVVTYLERARGNGAFTVALTNNPCSDLATVAEAVLPLAAGDEQAVAATKTYLNQIAALGLLASHAAGTGQRFAASIRLVAEELGELIPELERRVIPVASAFSFTGRMFVIGRGPEFASAREIALKLLETTRIAAEPMTATDLAHGPVAALDPLFPVWAIASNDETLSAVVEGAERARETGAVLIASGVAANAIPDAAYRLPLPDLGSSLLEPLLSVVPGQLFAWALARARGLDPDRPRGLSKVTLAK
jgi:glutamine---fructose-6-phosphate transaminase (isomerizing)